MRQFWIGAISGIALVGVVGIVAVPGHSSAATNSETYDQLNLFGQVFERVRADYVDKVNDSKLIDAAINGMLASLDPHSDYMNKKEYRAMQVETRGEFGGLGLEVTMEKGVVKVISPIDGTPAAKAGVKTGDLITAVDGKAILGLTLSQAVAEMRGPIGSTITLTIVRSGEKKPLNIKITRAVIKVRSVRGHRIGDVGYIRIAAFTEQTDVGLRKAIAKIQKEVGPKIQGWVIDLRNNPGGLLDQAVDVSDDFLNQGEIVSTRGRHADDDRRYFAQAHGDLLKGEPMVVLINGGTASAAEIVSGALKDHHRAIIMGTRSFGKGSVQTIIPMAGHGALRLTTARYYTPNGRSIQAEGIEPDIVVRPAKVVPLNEPQELREANLPHHLANPDGAAAKAAMEKSKETPVGETEAERNDYQLQRAVDLLHGLAVYGEHAGSQ